MRDLVTKINWKKVSGLVPAVIQDNLSGRMLMLGYMNEAALEKTINTGHVTFFSRTKERLWTKGETSGNTLNLKSIDLDCDQDTLLIKADPKGPTCHKGVESCFNDAPSASFLDQLSYIIKERFEEKPQGSYVSSLIDKGLSKMAQKVGEEGVEVALAAKDDDKEALTGEVADLFFHTLVLMEAKGVCLKDVERVLAARHQEST